MKKETEKLFNKMHQYLEDIDFEGDEDNAISEFIEKYNAGELSEYDNFNEAKSDEYLQRAYDSIDPEEKKRLAKKALKLNPQNLDAETLVAITESTPLKIYRKLETIRKKEEERLRKEGYFDDDSIGIFWGMIETRPYMRLLSHNITTLKELGRITEAIKECERVLELNENDNMGVRYDLIGMYCLLEKFDDAEKLFEKYNEDSIYMLFPLAIAQYKAAEYEKSRKTIRKVHAVNKFIADTLAFDLAIDGFEQEPDYEGYIEGCVRIGHFEEAESVIAMNELLLSSAYSFPDFYLETLQKVGAKK